MRANWFALILAVLCSQGALAEGILEPHGASASGTPQANVLVCEGNLSDDQKVSTCAARLSSTLKQLKSEGFIILSTSNCQMTPNKCPAEMGMWVSGALGSIAFIR